MKLAPPEAVTGCAYLGEVNGTSGWSAAAGGMSLAEGEALDAAAELKATHVVWYAKDASWGTSASGRAYRCPAERPDA